MAPWEAPVADTDSQDVKMAKRLSRRRQSYMVTPSLASARRASIFQHYLASHPDGKEAAEEAEGALCSPLGGGSGGNRGYQAAPEDADMFDPAGFLVQGSGSR